MNRPRVGDVVWWLDRLCRAEVTHVGELTVWLVPKRRGRRNGAVIVATWDEWQWHAREVQAHLF